MADVSRVPYPVLLVHGTAFRDYALPLYWGRIPRALRKEGAAVFYGKTEGWGSVVHNGALLARRIEQVLSQTGAQKLHIIAHSKGGLDAREALSLGGTAEKVASLTTVSTPHRGSRTIDHLLTLPKWAWRIAAGIVNALAFLFGDRHPDFLTVCREFSTAHMALFNQTHPDCPRIAYRSFAAQMASGKSDLLLALPHRLVRRYDGDNDGIVGVWSAEWGSEFTLLTAASRRGVSHVDEIDLRRRPLCKTAAAPHVRDMTELYTALYRRLRAAELQQTSTFANT